MPKKVEWTAVSNHVPANKVYKGALSTGLIIVSIDGNSMANPRTKPTYSYFILKYFAAVKPTKAGKNINTTLATT